MRLLRGAALLVGTHGAVDRFCNQAGTVAANLRRVLRLGTVDAMVTNADLPLPQALLEFRRHNPSVVIEFATAGPEELERQLVAGSRDVLIIPASTSAPSSTTSRS